MKILKSDLPRRHLAAKAVREAVRLKSVASRFTCFCLASDIFFGCLRHLRSFFKSHLCLCYAANKVYPLRTPSILVATQRANQISQRQNAFPGDAVLPSRRRSSLGNGCVVCYRQTSIVVSITLLLTGFPPQQHVLAVTDFIEDGLLKVNAICGHSPEGGNVYPRHQVKMSVAAS